MVVPAAVLNIPSMESRSISARFCVITESTVNENSLVTGSMVPEKIEKQNLFSTLLFKETCLIIMVASTFLNPVYDFLLQKYKNLEIDFTAVLIYSMKDFQLS